MALIVGTAGWSIPKETAAAFEGGESVLKRYARRMPGVEINSSFYRPHRAATWARWAQSVPADFRFSVKMPKIITHEKRLANCGAEIATFLDAVDNLGPKFAVLLVQLPPSLDLDPKVARRFFTALAQSSRATIVCEPRHASWFTPNADALLRDLLVARVAADPSLCADAAQPGGWHGLAYWRLHGSPTLYRSAYGEERLAAYAERLDAGRLPNSETWCIFDNTASGAALRDALMLQALMA